MDPELLHKATEAQNWIFENQRMVYAIAAGALGLLTYAGYKLRRWARRPYGKSAAEFGMKVANNYEPNSNVESPYTQSALNKRILSDPRLGAMSKEV